VEVVASAFVETIVVVTATHNGVNRQDIPRWEEQGAHTVAGGLKLVRTGVACWRADIDVVIGEGVQFQRKIIPQILAQIQLPAIFGMCLESAIAISSR